MDVVLNLSSCPTKKQLREAIDAHMAQRTELTEAEEQRARELAREYKHLIDPDPHAAS